ncbi:hypothetical protein WBJ53_18950 [Spirosoma sp. SC4-14]|uniref:hypothetical protein n=1 Tax=Spirosoma sp. SC4-14 TaxID=3128900 RepID=UPI0030D5A730
MKTLLFVCTVWAIPSGLLMSCEQKIVQTERPGISPGNYQITGTVSYTIEEAVSSQPIAGTLTVYKAKEGDYFFNENTNLGILYFQVSEQNLSFSIASVQDRTKVGYTTYYGSLDKSSSGKVVGNIIEYDRFVTTSSTGLTSPTGEKITYTKNIRKHVYVKAVK